jgi:hypothetical protein
MLNLASDQLLRLRTDKNGWPNPESSIGVWYRKMGRYDCWEATGPAREKFVQLAEEIKVYLENFSDPVLDTVTWSIYMMGKSKATAKPTVMFCCREAKPRRTVRKMIDDSEIFLKYPGIKTGDSTLPPDFDQLIPLSLPTDDSGNGLTYSNSQSTVLCPQAKRLIGSRIYVKSTTEDSSSLQQATAGGIVQWKGRYFCMTAQHSFADSPSLRPSRVMDDCDFEFKLAEESEEETDEEFVEMTSRGSFTPDTVRSEFSFTSDGDTSGDDLPDISSHIRSAFYGSSGAGSSMASSTASVDSLPTNKPTGSKSLKLPTLDVVGNVFLTSTDDGHSDLDYALFEIQPAHLPSDGSSIHAKAIATGPPKDVEVTATTSSAGTLSGRLCGTPSYMRLSRGKAFQEVWTVRFNGRLARGDSGSWVINAQTGELLGHIVAGSPDTGVVYIVPAYQVFNDVSQRLGGGVELFAKASSEAESTTTKGAGSSPAVGVSRDPPGDAEPPDRIATRTLPDLVRKALWRLSPAVTPKEYSGVPHERERRRPVLARRSMAYSPRAAEEMVIEPPRLSIADTVGLIANKMIGTGVFVTPPSDSLFRHVALPMVLILGLYIYLDILFRRCGVFIPFRFVAFPCHLILSLLLSLPCKTPICYFYFAPSSFPRYL